MKIVLVMTNAWPLMGGLEKLALRAGQHLRFEGHNAQIVARFSSGRRDLAGYFSQKGGRALFDNEGVPTHHLAVNAFTRIFPSLSTSSSGGPQPFQ